MFKVFFILKVNCLRNIKAISCPKLVLVDQTVNPKTEGYASVFRLDILV